MLGLLEVRELKMGKVLFFETYSIIQTLVLFRFIRRASVIYFHKKGFPRTDPNPRGKRIVERLIYLFNKKAEIRIIPVEKVYQYNWDLNKESLAIVEELVPDIQRSSAYKMVLGIIRDANILKFFKQLLAAEIPDRCLFLKVAKDLGSEHDSLVVIPKSSLSSFLETKLFGREGLGKYSIPVIYAANNIRDFFSKVISLAVLLLLPPGFVILRTRVTLRKINRGSYDVAMPMIWGFHEGEGRIGGVRRPHNDGYLYNQELTRGRIIHTFREPRFTPEVKANYKKVMDKKGIPYIDKKDYKVNMSFLLAAGKIQLRVLTGLFKNPFCWRDSADYIRYSIGVIQSMFEKLLEFENVDYKVEFVRHDYTASHIVETILCNQHGKRTVGIQHTASPYDLPQLSYVHFNKYIVYGEALVRNFLPYWRELRLEKTGRESIDWVVNIKKNEDTLNELKNRLREKYRERKYMAVILLPSPVEFGLRKRWDEMYNALRELKNLDIDINVFLRFRAKDHLYGPEYIRCFDSLPTWDERIIIDHENFTTYELISLCNLCIANSGSFAIFEAMAVEARVFPFDFIGTAKYYFSNYGKDFILHNKNDILRVLKGLENNYEGFDCNWELLYREGSFHYDGCNLERIQNVVLETLKEVKI